MFCVIYALIGIPLTLMLLAVVGNHIVHYLNETCAWLVNRIRRYHTDYEFESADAQINAPVWVALPIIFLFLAIMSSLYCALEGWDFGTALYFIFITFTTIGFGDVVPKSAAVSLISFRKSQALQRVTMTIIPLNIECYEVILDYDKNVLCTILDTWCCLVATKTFLFSSFFYASKLALFDLRPCLYGLVYPRQPSPSRQLYGAFIWSCEL